MMSNVVDVERFVATRDRAAQIAGLSARQADYWSRTGVVHPTLDTRVTPGRAVRLYEFTELMSLMVAAELRARKIKLHHIRAIVDRLRREGYDSPLSQLSFATVAGRIYFQREDGSWEGDILPGQVVIHQVLDLEPLRTRISAAAQRNADRIGKIERRRGAMGSKPVIAGTRVPVETVRRYLDAGRTPEQIIAAFPLLEVEDIDAVRAASLTA